MLARARGNQTGNDDGNKAGFFHVNLLKLLRNKGVARMPIGKAACNELGNGCSGMCGGVVDRQLPGPGSVLCLPVTGTDDR